MRERIGIGIGKVEGFQIFEIKTNEKRKREKKTECACARVCVCV